MDKSFSLDEVRAELHTAVLSDTLDELGRTGQVAEPRLVPLAKGMRAIGKVRTARAVPVTGVPEQPYAKLMQAIDGLNSGDVLVLGMEGTSTSGVFGGLLAAAVTATGARGVVVDGFVRDADEIEESELPTFMRGFRPLDSAGRDDVVDVGGPVTIAGVLVQEGDFVFADRDGIVFVPGDIAQEVFSVALQKVRSESEVMEALQSGMPITEAFSKYGIL